MRAFRMRCAARYIALLLDYVIAGRAGRLSGSDGNALSTIE
jgi:hypothetical protein